MKPESWENIIFCHIFSGSPPAVSFHVWDPTLYLDLLSINFIKITSVGEPVTVCRPV